MLHSHQLVVLFAVLVRHQHFHCVGHLVWVGDVPPLKDPVQLAFVHVGHPVLAHVLLVLCAHPGRPSVGLREREKERLRGWITPSIRLGCLLRHWIYCVVVAEEEQANGCGLFHGSTDEEGNEELWAMEEKKQNKSPSE